jgi:hypothetical protein
MRLNQELENMGRHVDEESLDDEDLNLDKGKGS